MAAFAEVGLRRAVLHLQAGVFLVQAEAHDQPRRLGLPGDLRDLGIVHGRRRDEAVQARTADLQAIPVLQGARLAVLLQDPQPRTRLVDAQFGRFAARKKIVRRQRDDRLSRVRRHQGVHGLGDVLHAPRHARPAAQPDLGADLELERLAGHQHAPVDEGAIAAVVGQHPAPVAPTDHGVHERDAGIFECRIGAQGIAAEHMLGTKHHAVAGAGIEQRTHWPNFRRRETHRRNGQCSSPLEPRERAGSPACAPADRAWANTPGGALSPVMASRRASSEHASHADPPARLRASMASRQARGDFACSTPPSMPASGTRRP